METLIDPRQSAVQISLATWSRNVRQVDDILARLSDADLEREIAPGRNRGIYLIGHLIAVHDQSAALLGMEPRSYPQYDAIFLENPDRDGQDFPSIDELRGAWKDIHSRIASYFDTLTPEDWFDRHTAVSADDFVNQPLRNKFAVLTSRISHLAYHVGQLALLHA